MKIIREEHKIEAFNMQELLGVLAIIGILLLLALPNLMPRIAKTKALEAQLQLKYIHNTQITYRYLYSKYSTDMYELDFEPPKTTKENGTSNYSYEIVSASGTSFTARATAINDFDGDGVFNVWEMDESGVAKEKVKD
ncbi:general secretion pathway protein GspG [uncultured Winogradskyella sp.]|uniref:general secretion pathway protein GspG n=1 Tax=uncultured Winogradskyella sp. TaxID=395353 RepID=UPI00261B9DC1|nr:general secretion pathway protein GspG [uncultured Winogradskyella sp.]